MLKYKHLKCHFDFFQLYNDFEGEFWNISKTAVFLLSSGGQML
jgi:hypothetical protein